VTQVNRVEESNRMLSIKMLEANCKFLFKSTYNLYHFLTLFKIYVRIIILMIYRVANLRELAPGVEVSGR
jgi:hypothetical protein